MKTIAVDFNSVDFDDLTVGLASDANHQLFVGDTVLAYDNEGCNSIATVARIGYNGTVHIILDPASWRELVPA